MITSKIIQWCRERDIPVLPIHDGYRCQVSKVDQVKTMMAGAFRWVLILKASDPVPEITVE